MEDDFFPAELEVDTPEAFESRFGFTITDMEKCIKVPQATRLTVSQRDVRL